MTMKDLVFSLQADQGQAVLKLNGCGKETIRFACPGRTSPDMPKSKQDALDELNRALRKALEELSK